MNIAIDVLAILGPGSKNRGIGNYTTSQLKKLFELDKTNNYYLLNFYENTSLKDILLFPDNVQEFYFYTGDANQVLRGMSNFQKIIGDIVRKFISEHKIDVFYVTSPFDGILHIESSWLESTKKVVTIYDVIPYIFKERYLQNKEVYHDYMTRIKTFEKFDKLLAISESAKQDMIKYFNVDETSVDCIYAGVDECYTELQIPTDEKKDLKKNYNIQDEYIMCTGGDDDRKNIGELIIAYSNLPKDLTYRYQLVIACKLSEASENRYKKLAEHCGVGDRVILTNFVPLEHLIKLYNMACVVAFPSQYEGFGLPVVEAMACGTPVLTSNNSSLGEIAEGAAVLVDPFDNKDITRGLIEILTKADLTDLVKKGYERLEKFTWKKVAEATLESINSLKPVNIKDSLNQKKMACFTPLPPLMSGISDYSMDILEQLSKSFLIDVFVDDGYEVNELQLENIKVFNHKKFESKRFDYDEILYQVGNSEFHAYMIPYIQKHSGTVVLHDYNLHGLIVYMQGLKKDTSLYKMYLLEDYSEDIVDRYLEEFTTGKTLPKTYDYVSNGFVTNYAKKIIVHSNYAKKKLLEKSIGANVVYIPIYAKIEEERITESKLIKEQLNLSEDTIIVSTFGHIHETKRIMPILKAFKKIAEINSKVILFLVGEPAAVINVEIESFIAENNLKDKVVITGYIEIESFESYIAATDICLNLRYPYNGESSATLTRSLAKGNCIVVNDLGSFSEVPDDCCVKLPSPGILSNEKEVELIIDTINRLINNKECIKVIGENARNFALNHLDINFLIKQYTDFLLTEPVEFNENSLSTLLESIKKTGLVGELDLFQLAKTISYLKKY